MNISLIAAISNNYIIGKNNTIPWYIPQDLSWFKYHTINKPIIMGRLTWQSINKNLPNRYNIVISSKKIVSKNVKWFHSLDTALSLMSLQFKEIMVIGGNTLYTQTIQYANRLYLTHIHKCILGDTYFPKYNTCLWNRIFYQTCYSHKPNYFYHSFEILDRKK
ncbi:MAG: type 3 dihydrofolate reductase [Buchnera aphidicola (Eriosoma harunire)]